MSDNDDDSISDDDSVLEPLFEDEEENQFVDEPKENQQYYIGICKMIKPENYYYMLSVVSNRAFFQYSYGIIQKYLQLMSLVYVCNPNVEIMQLCIQEDSTYNVILKTFWIRLVQRNWRRVLRERLLINIKRGSLVARKHIELRGRYPSGLNSMPSLRGMIK